MKFSKIILFLLVINSVQAKLLFDSDQSFGLDAYLKNSSIISYYGDTDDDLKNDIKDQLKYLIGTFNNYNSTPDLGHVDIEILSKKRIDTSDVQEVTYNASFLISWDRDQQAPQTMKIFLPKSIIKTGVQDLSLIHI